VGQYDPFDARLAVILAAPRGVRCPGTGSSSGKGALDEEGVRSSRQLHDGVLGLRVAGVDEGDAVFGPRLVGDALGAAFGGRPADA
jgi:hypothetical protein